MNSRPVSLIYVFLAFVCFTGSVLARTQNQQPVADRNAGSISGRVTVDGKPKAGLVVELLTTITHGQRRPIAKATTNKTGKYVLTNIPSGTYDVSPSAPTLVVPNQGQSRESGKLVTIESGEAVKGIDFDLVTRGSVSGRVHDVSDAGIKGQTVELIGDNNYSRPFYSYLPGENITNEEGVYRISGVPPGRYIVKVGIAYGLIASGADGTGDAYRETFHPDTNDATKATVVEIVTGRETTDVDITVGRPMRSYSIVGQLVVVETGAPVPNVGLGVVATSENGNYYTQLSGAYRSDTNGEFRIQGAMPGHYAVAPENDPALNAYGDAVSFDVRDADVTGLKIPMHSASILTGVVTIDGNVGLPVADILSKLTISAHTLSDELMNSSSLSPVTADGGFRIAGVRPGKIMITSSVQGGGLEGLSLLRIERNGVEVRDEIEVRAGEDITGLRLAMGSGNCVLRGAVKIEGGPLEGVNLYVLYRSTSSEPPTFFRAQLDARRHFVINGLMPGEYELKIGPMTVEVSGSMGSRMMSRMPTVSQTVVVKPGADAEVILVMTLKPEMPPPRLR